MQDLTVNIETDNNEVIVRQGKARPITLPSRIVKTGNINAPLSWFLAKQGAEYFYNLSLCNLIVDRDNLEIVFTSNDDESETSQGGHQITGRLVPDTSISKLGVNNTSKTYSAKQLMQTLKMSRSLFADRDENLRIVKELSQFKAKVTKEVESRDDLNGNELYHFERSVNSEFNLEFTLSASVYKGLPKSTFLVEVRFDVRDKAVTYWLESVEYKDLQDDQRDSVIDDQAAVFSAKGVTVIEK